MITCPDNPHFRHQVNSASCPSATSAPCSPACAPGRGSSSECCQGWPRPRPPHPPPPPRALSRTAPTYCLGHFTEIRTSLQNTTYCRLCVNSLLSALYFQPLSLTVFEGQCSRHFEGVLPRSPRCNSAPALPPPSAGSSLASQHAPAEPCCCVQPSPAPAAAARPVHCTTIDSRDRYWAAATGQSSPNLSYQTTT